MDAKRAMEVNKLLDDLDADIEEMEPTKIDPASDWLSQYGVLTPNYLKKSILYIINLDKHIRNVDIDFIQAEKKLIIKIFISRLGFWFFKAKIMGKMIDFANLNFDMYNVEILIKRQSIETKVMRDE